MLCVLALGNGRSMCSHDLGRCALSCAPDQHRSSARRGWRARAARRVALPRLQRTRTSELFTEYRRARPLSSCITARHVSCARQLVSSLSFLLHCDRKERCRVLVLAGGTPFRGARRRRAALRWQKKQRRGHGHANLVTAHAAVVWSAGLRVLKQRHCKQRLLTMWNASAAVACL